MDIYMDIFIYIYGWWNMLISLFISHSGLFSPMVLMWSVSCIQFPRICGPLCLQLRSVCLFVYIYANYSLSLSLHIFIYIFLNLDIYPSMLQPWGFNLLRWSYFSPLRFPILETASSRTWFSCLLSWLCPPDPWHPLLLSDLWFWVPA